MIVFVMEPLIFYFNENVKNKIVRHQDFHYNISID